jgi:arylsulfatase A
MGRPNIHPGCPCLLYLAPSAPHRPCVAPDVVKGKSQARPRGDLVMLVDWIVREVDRTLQRLRLRGNTLLIVAGNNGAQPAYVDGNTYGRRTCGDLRGSKGQICQGGRRIPFIARWPGTSWLEARASILSATWT